MSVDTSYDERLREFRRKLAELVKQSSEIASDSQVWGYDQMTGEHHELMRKTSNKRLKKEFYKFREFSSFSY